MTQETFKKAKELDSKINELNYRINRKLEEIKIFQNRYNPEDIIQFFDFYEGSVELTYKEALSNIRHQLLQDEFTLKQLKTEFNNL